jgi:diguanylate cyclase (GGDEF)-like protein
MPTRRSAADVLFRAFAGLSALGGLTICHALGIWQRPAPVGLILCLVLIICGGLVILVRSWGTRVAAGTGCVVGLSLALALTHASGAPWLNQAAFTFIAGAVTGLLGYLAAAPATAAAGSAVPRGELQSGPGWNPAPIPGEAPPEGVLSALLADFHVWIETAATQVPAADRWSAFDQFVRQTLRERLGAAGVRVFRVSAKNARLVPLTRHLCAPVDWPAARAGLIGHVVTTGRIYVAGRSERDPLIADLARAVAQGPAPATAERWPEVPLLPQTWTWLLPLVIRGRTRALVAVEHVERAALAGEAAATTVRDVLQLFWSQVRSLVRLGHTRMTDRVSGMLNRPALLARLKQAADESTRDGEPLTVLTIALEGLRRLDDTGCWSRHDALIEKLGQVLRSKVRSDDLLGRFNDDHYVVVLRRLDSALGALVAAKILDKLRTSLFATVAPPPLNSTLPAERQLALRGGLAGSGLRAVDGLALLERSLGLLEHARRSGMTLASDLAEPLPAELPRHASATLAGPRPNPPGSANDEALLDPSAARPAAVTVAASKPGGPQFVAVDRVKRP